MKGRTVADAGNYGHGSWARHGVAVVEAAAAGDQLPPGMEPRELVEGERVMVCYRSGLTLPGSVSGVKGDPGMVLVVVELAGPDRCAFGWWPGTMLRTLVHEQCVPGRVIERVGLDILRAHQ